MIEWNLPTGWGTRKLGDIAHEETEQIIPSDTPDAIFNYWGLDAIQPGEFSEPAPNYVKGNEILSTCITFSSNHILYSKLRPYLNKVIIPSTSGIGSTEWVVLNPNPTMINRQYLGYVLRTQKFVDYANYYSAGGRMPRAKKSALRIADIPIPFPDDPTKSLSTQIHIVTRVDTIFNELTEARRLHEKIVVDSNRLMDAVLADVFPNPDNDLKSGWILRTVEELSNDPQYGYTASANKQSNGVKFLRITDIQNGNVDWAQVPSCECTRRDIDQYGLKDGDIVFARTGATTGKTFLVRHPPEAIFASYLIRLQITKYTSSDFVYWFFQSPYYWRQIITRGGAQPNMNAQLLKKVRIPVPESSELQERIVERILSAKNEIDGMLKNHQETGVLLASIENSILAQAFRGEL